MNIITAGCSFTKYKWSCWPNFIKWFEPKHEIINLGASASSNETIARTVVNAVMKYKNIDKIYIMWSGPNRYEHVINEQPEKQKEDATWSSYNPDFKWYQYYGGHVDKEKHKYYEKYFLNEKQNEIRLLEKILILMKNTVINILLYKQIDWDKFIFYKNKKGLFDFAEENYPEQFFKPEDLHPLPLVHYKWVKDIMYKSDIVPPKNEYKKLVNFKKDFKK